MPTPIITTVSNAAATYNLTDLATTKAELGLQSADTTNDPFLNRAITQISKAIRQHCNRAFHVERLTDTFWMRRGAYPHETIGDLAQLQLSRYPLVSLMSLVQQGPADPSTTTLVSGTDFTIDAAKGRLIRLSTQSSELPTGLITRWEPFETTVDYVSGYGASIVTVQNIPATPFQITPSDPNVNNAAGTFSIDLGVVFTVGGAALTPIALTGTPSTGQYTVDTRFAVSGSPNANLGQYTFAAADAGKSVTITSGFSEIPEDLVDATLREITERWYQKGRDPMVMEKNVGTIGQQRFWVGGSPGQSGVFTPEVDALLAPYRIPTAG